MPDLPSPRWIPRARGLVFAVVLLLPGAGQAESFVNFESGQVRPLALSPDRSRLFALNTPDNQLEIFALGGDVPVHLESVSVGLEPIAIALRGNIAWVVNHLSDSISLVDVSESPARVVRTLLTCDEPRDIVFAGAGKQRAFVTAARRGQNCSVAARLSNPGTPRAVVQVWDADDPGAAIGGEPIDTLRLFGDTPRALATDGDTVWAAVFASGNQTVPLGEGVVCNGGATAAPCSAGGFPMAGGIPAPNVDADGVPQPEVGLIVKYDPPSGEWHDELGRNWSPAVRFDLPDLDVFAIDAETLDETARWASVGTVLFNIAVNPVSGTVYVSNTEAINEVRFEGFGHTFGNTSVNGHLHESRISVLDGDAVRPRHLNKHIDYARVPSPAGTKEHSLATPLAMAVSPDGATLYVAAYGSSKVGVFDTAALEDDSFEPSSSSHITVSGGGPAGLALDESAHRLYVLTRFDNALSVVDTSTLDEIAHVPLSFNPEPIEVREGRRFLYDALETSSNGESSCAACHIFADQDALAWDLGDPDLPVAPNLLRKRIPAIAFPGLPIAFPDFHGLKGPMLTQTLRGMDGHGSLHWRGDKNGALDPDSNSFDEVRAFEKFNGAFQTLLGRTEELEPDDMRAFADFILTVLPGPNPIRALDNTLDASEEAGRSLYFGRITAIVLNCNGCHTLAPEAGFFGADGFATFEGETQMFKIPHLRNAYQKVGMFGGIGLGPNDHMGPQVRGTGFLHDGSIDRLRNFFRASVFSVTAAERRELEAFVFAFPSNFAPIVGQQITRSVHNGPAVDPRIDLLIARAAEGECDLVVKGVLEGEARGGLRGPDGLFQLDRAGDVRDDATLRGLTEEPGQALTYTCVPPGSGERIGIDHDEDGSLDRDELDHDTDPKDAGTFFEPLALTRATAWPTRSKLGRIRIEGIAPEIDLSGGLTVRVSDGMNLDVTVSLAADECLPSSTGAIRCRHRDPSIKKKKVTASFVPLASSKGLVEFRIFLNRHDFTRPQAGPLKVRLEESTGRVLEGTNASCTAHVAKLVCRD